jgi:hypothetical protein
MHVHVAKYAAVSGTNVGNKLFVPVLNNSQYDPESGPGSVVGIATGYGLDGPGSNHVGGENFCTYPDRPWGPPSLLYNG